MYILCSITIFPKWCRSKHNMEKYCRARQDIDDNTIRRMRRACWITKAPNTLRLYNTCCFSTATVVTRTRYNVTFYA